VAVHRLRENRSAANLCRHLQDRKVEFVYAFEHNAVLAQLADTTMVRDSLAALLRRLAFTTPRNGDWEGAFRSYQAEARKQLALLQVAR
jgi:hypothetical protein